MTITVDCLVLVVNIISHLESPVSYFSHLNQLLVSSFVNAVSQRTDQASGLPVHQSYITCVINCHSKVFNNGLLLIKSYIYTLKVETYTIKLHCCIVKNKNY